MPMTGASIGTALAALAPFFEYFRPTKSPYLLVVLISAIGVLVLNYLFDEEFYLRAYWYALAAPVFILAILLTAFIFLHKERVETSEEERELSDQHLKFSRSICISAAILCLVVGGWYTASNTVETVFIVHYIACTWQIAVFTIYAAARLRRQEPSGFLNHFQVAMVTSVYLIAATACLSFAAGKHYVWCGEDSYTTVLESCATEVVEKETEDGTDWEDVGRVVESFYFISYGLFLALWVACQYYWLRRLRQIIRISIRDET